MGNVILCFSFNLRHFADFERFVDIKIIIVYELLLATTNRNDRISLVLADFPAQTKQKFIGQEKVAVTPKIRDLNT